MHSDLILIGSGGCMRELVWQLQELNEQKITWNIVGYVDDLPQDQQHSVFVGTQELPYLGDDHYLLKQKRFTNVAICVGSPVVRKKIALKLSQNPNIRFPNLILSDTKICKDVKIGKGCIISMDVRISTNVTVGDFVFFNTGSKVCHDGWIGDYVTLSPDVKLAGTVTVGANSELGMGTKVIQGIKIAENIVTGAGAVVVKDLEKEGTYVGVPVRRI